MELKISFNKFGLSETINLNKLLVNENFTNKHYMKYLKLVFTNEERFKNRFLNEIKRIIELFPKECIVFDINKFFKELETDYKEAIPFNFADAFKLSTDISSKVFGAIGVETMIKELGATRIAVSGMPVKHKVYSKTGDCIGEKEYDVIYETHQINTVKLKLDEPAYMVKCWCTSTNKEHWLWIESKYKDNPLEAIASTCRPHENIIPYITGIKRQGDVFFYELSENVSPDLKKPRIPFNAEQYFKLLIAQS
jgi:hypothetical protein